MSFGNSFICGSKDQRSRPRVTKQVCTGLQKQRHNAACCVYVSHAGFSSLQCPAAQAMLETPDVTSLWALLLPTAGFSIRGVFRSRPAARNIAETNWTCWICFDFVERTKFYNRIVRHCCRLWQQSRMLLRQCCLLLLHCCWCGRGLTETAGSQIISYFSTSPK